MGAKNLINSLFASSTAPQKIKKTKIEIIFMCSQHEYLIEDIKNDDPEAIITVQYVVWATNDIVVCTISEQ